MDKVPEQVKQNLFLMIEKKKKKRERTSAYRQDTQKNKEREQYVCVAPPILITHKSLRGGKREARGLEISGWMSVHTRASELSRPLLIFRLRLRVLVSFPSRGSV